MKRTKLHNIYYRILQILTSVQQATEAVAVKPVAAILMVASLVPVNQDTLEMDLVVQVKQKLSCNVIFMSNLSKFVIMLLCCAIILV